MIKPAFTTEVAVYVISDSANWTDTAIDLAHGLGARAEGWTWSEAPRLKDPGEAMLVDATEVGVRHRDLLDHWAGLGWQPLCIISVPPRRGSARICRWLTGRGFGSLETSARPHAYLRELRCSLKDVIEGGARLVPCVASALGCYD